ncbi:hypothetical protein HYW44_01350 [Candidatus Daviesbacteria bacterium]|nr:hypothetical protein [Candidatus Daviesbacteria bacterium]
MSSLNTRKLNASANIRKSDVLLANFIGGLAWGLGSVIGATIVVALLVWILNILGLFDIVRDYFPKNPYGNIQLYRAN